jgi:hypothetical protein
MSNVQLAIASWFVLLVHVVVGLVAWRRLSDLPLVPLVNVAVALCVLGYWVVEWFGYVFKGITWYWNDQLVPLYAVAALSVAALALAGRLHVAWPNVVVFSIHALISLMAVLYVSFFRMGRLF